MEDPGQYYEILVKPILKMSFGLPPLAGLVPRFPAILNQNPIFEMVLFKMLRFQMKHSVFINFQLISVKYYLTRYTLYYIKAKHRMK